ncbi:MAG: membrane protein insertase YidC, partial [Elusimicrobiota bacterium]
MDKNLILAVALSVLVYVGWFKFVEKRYPPPPSRKAPVAGTAVGARTGGAAPGTRPRPESAAQKSALP